MDRLALLALLTLTVACGGDPEVAVLVEPAKSCALSVTLSGTLEGTIPEDANMGCATLDSVDSGINNVFLLLSGVSQFEMLIKDVHEGEKGSGFPTNIYLHDMTSRRWGTPKGACTVDITEQTFDSSEQNEEVGELRSYVVAGKGYCSAEAQPTGQGAYGLVAISEFDFRLPSIWHD